MTLPIKAFIKSMLVAATLLACIFPAFAERSAHYTGVFQTAHLSHPLGGGTLDALFYPAAHVLRYTATWQTLNGPVTTVQVNDTAAKHDTLHQTPLEHATSSSLTGSLLLTPQQEMTLENGQLSLILATKAAPKGAARVLLRK